jgi:cysteine desulfurase
MKVYLDNASTTPLAVEVREVMMDILSNHHGNPSSIHHHGRKSRSIIEDARKKVAKIINASIGEIFFTSSATEANNMIIKRSILDLGVRHIISSPTEHHCVLHTLDSVKREYPYVKITMLSVNQYGEIDTEELEKTIASTPDKTLVSLMYGNNEIGTIHPIDEVSKICKATNSYFHCDSVQMLGKYPLDVQNIYFSFLTGTAHKFHGPKGSGFFYLNNENIIQPFIYGGAQERNIRAGTENVAGIAGLALALEQSIAYMDARRDLISVLKARFDKGIEKLEGCYLNCPPEKGMYHISSVSFPASDTVDMLMFNLDIAGISASSGSACSAGIEEDSHVLVAIGHPSERKTIRFSFSSYTTIEEIDYTLSVLQKLV